MFQTFSYSLISEEATRYFMKKDDKKISQNSYENSCVGNSFLIKSQVCNFIKIDTLTQILLSYNETIKDKNK